MTYNKVGLGSVGSYQVSGKPYCKSFASLAQATAGNATEIVFPAVTQWVSVVLEDGSSAVGLRIGFSQLGVEDAEGNKDYFLLYSNTTGTTGDSVVFNVKCTSLWIGSHTSTTVDNVSIMAGLTGIATDELPNNWSGSAGVG